MSLPDYFAFYGIDQSFHPDPAELRKRFYEKSREFHPDRAQTGNEEAADDALKMSALNNEAYRTLGNPDKLVAYILKLHGVIEENEQYKLPSAFLMEMMELNESINEADENENSFNEAQVVFENAMNDLKMAANPLLERFDQGDRSEELLAALKDFYYRKKYLQRISERLGS